MFEPVNLVNLFKCMVRLLPCTKLTWLSLGVSQGMQMVSDQLHVSFISSAALWSPTQQTKKYSYNLCGDALQYETKSYIL